MIRTTVTYSDAHSRVKRTELRDDDGAQPNENSGWYVGGGVVAFQRRNAKGALVTTMIPLERVLRIETTETASAAARRLVDLIAVTEAHKR